MAYVIVDPCGQYPSLLMSFMAKLDQGAIAVFSSPARWLLWRDKWSKTLGKYVLDSYLATRFRTFDELASTIRSDWHDLSGIVPWDEQSVLFGARLAERLELGWNSSEVIERCRDKAMMKAWLRDHSKVRVNASTVVDDAEQALAFQRKLDRWPIVVKPTGGSGSESVYFPESDDELLHACQQVLETGSGEVLLEEYLGGQEMAVNGIVDVNGDLLVTDAWLYDRRSSHGVPNLYYRAVKLHSHEDLFLRAGKYAADVVEALGLRRAPIHMEVKVDDQGPCLIEVGARLPGGSLPVLASKMHGRSLFELAACHYLGQIPAQASDVDYGRYDEFHGRVLNGIQTQEVRRIRRVHGVDIVEALPSFQGFGVLRPIGTRARVSVDLDTTAWELYLIHRSLEQIEKDSTIARQVLRYE